MTKDEERAGLEALRNQLLASGVPCAALGAFEDEIRAEAAERAVKWQELLCKGDSWSCDGCTECEQLRSAVIGGKE